MRHLISGVAGFIGSHLADRLIAGGAEVVGLDNLKTGSRQNIVQLDGHPHFHFLPLDVTHPIDVPGPFDHVWHLASLASPVHYQKYPIDTLQVGSAGTLHMLDIARRDGARFLLASTSECYGDPLEHPQVETYYGNVNPVGIRACYDESKRYAEALTMAYHREFTLRTNIARIFNTYGPRMALNDGRVVPAFLSQAIERKPLTVFGDGSQTRSFCYISDLVDGLVCLSGSDERFPTNLGNPREITILEFAKIVSQIAGIELKVENGPLGENDPRRRQPDIAKARRVLGWEPKRELENGLRETMAYFEQRILR